MPADSVAISAREFRRNFFNDFVLNRTLLAPRRAENAALYPNVACFAFDSISSEIMVFGRFEKSLLDVTFSGLSRFSEIFARSVALDIGANIGNHALYFAPQFKEVYAIEANPRTFALLALNAAHPGVANVTALQAAIGERRQKLTFAEHRNEVGRSGIIGATNKFSDVLRDQPGRTFEIETENGDEFLASRVNGRISLVKIDVEGFEASVIRGLAATIRAHRPIILLEQLANEIENGTSDAIELLRRYGYDEFYHAESAIAIKQRHLRLLYKLLCGDRLSLKPLDVLKSTHYPLIVCCASGSELSLRS